MMIVPNSLLLRKDNLQLNFNLLQYTVLWRELENDFSQLCMSRQNQSGLLEKIRMVLKIIKCFSPLLNKHYPGCLGGARG